MYQSDKDAPPFDPLRYAADLKGNPQNKDRIAKDPQFVEREVFRQKLLRKSLNEIRIPQYERFDRALESLYIEKFSTTELASILRFLQSPAGRSYVTFNQYAESHIFDLIAPDITGEAKIMSSVLEDIDREVNSKFPPPTVATDAHR